MTALLSHVLAWLRAPLAAHRRGRCDCPLCHKAERDARTAIGMAARHPERIIRDLPGGQEEYLAAVAEALWPDDEYAAIIAELWRGDQP